MAQHVRACCAGRYWFGHDDLEEDPPCRDVAASSCRVDAATASLGLAGRVRRLERIVEQIGGLLVPQALKGDVDGLVGEQIGGTYWRSCSALSTGARAEPYAGAGYGFLYASDRGGQLAVRAIGARAKIASRSRLWVSSCLRSRRTACRVYLRSVCRIVCWWILWVSSCLRSRRTALPIVPQERVLNRVAEQISGVLVPQITEDGLPTVPQECVQNRTPEQLVVDVAVPQIMEAIAKNRFPGAARRRCASASDHGGH